MPLYVTVSEGPRADQTRPVMAISDQSIIGELLRSIARRGDECAPAGGSGPAAGTALRLIERDASGREVVHP